MMARAKAREEKIFVTVRVRPLNSKEVAQGEVEDWACVNDHTVVFKAVSAERSALPSSYVFDRVFGPDSTTQLVYEQGAKDVSLSALTGLNSTIFAYGQTSSGKTFTMRGIMECALCDIYDYIRKSADREFVLKVSGMEIYNEVVRDLLHPEAGGGGGNGLKLLDDPDKGTVVEKIVEEVIQDMTHMRRILAVCEAQRQVGQTSLNDTSSRSHQIIRLSVESFPREASNEASPGAALVATLNFVDLAGSERASQTQAEGARLKEGTYINRSLLALGTVIRKLSSASSGHIPYRDSKLTRILQNSLGGNARTAIICTMSPAHTHAEQTRNTLSFATRAKEVTNKAEVNVVISDKLLVKQLQKEVARLEAEKRTPEAPALSMSTEALLFAKDLEIERMTKEIMALQVQRDAALGELAAQARLQAEQKTSEDASLSLSTEALLLAKDQEMERMAAEMKELQTERDAAQQELAERVRREAERKTPEVSLLSMSTEALLLAKDLEIEKMATEIRDLQMQLDAAQGEAAGKARVEAERKNSEVPKLSISTEALLLAKDLEVEKLAVEMKELQMQRDAAQGELAEQTRLEHERKTAETAATEELLLAKDTEMAKMTSEMKVLQGLRDAAQGELVEVKSRMEAELHEVRKKLEVELDAVKQRLQEEQEAKVLVVQNPVQGEDAKEAAESTANVDDAQQLVRKSGSALMLVKEIHKLEHLQDELGEDASRALEALQKNTLFLRLAQGGMNEDAAAAISKLKSEIQEMQTLRANPRRSEQGSSTPRSMRRSMKQELCRLQALGDEKSNAEATIANLEAQLENVQLSLDNMLLESVPASPAASEEASPGPSCGTPVKKKKSMPFAVTSNIRQRLLAGSPPSSPGTPGTRRSHVHENNENAPPPSPRTPGNTRSQGKDTDGGSKEAQRKKNPVDVRKMQNLFKTAAEENIKSIRAYVSELKERVSKLQYQKQLLMCQVVELEASKSGGEEIPREEGEGEGEEEAVAREAVTVSPPLVSWHVQYETQRSLIIELWHICQVSLTHRTQFYLLFRGDRADAIYLEVELRRLRWLHENGADPGIMGSPNPSFSPSPIKSLFQEEQGTPLSASARSLRRERELLARRMRTRLTLEEREELYSRWEVPVGSKQRRLQLTQRLWTSCDKEHVQASAEVVARIVGFWEPGNLPSKEMFELNLSHPNYQRPWIVNGLNSLSNLLNL